MAAAKSNHGSRPSAAHVRLPGDTQQRRDHADGRADGGRGDRRRVPRVECRRAGRRLRVDGVAGDRPRVDLGTRRRRAAEYPGPGPRAGDLAAWRISAGRCCSPPATAARRPSATPRWTATPAAGSPRSPASTRRFCSTGSSWMENTGPAGIGPLAGALGRQQPAADRRAAAADRRPDRRGRPDALPRARRDRARGDPRQA